MSRDYGYGGRGRGERWDAERFEIERDRNRFGSETRERFEERDGWSEPRYGGGGGRVRESSFDEQYERRGPRGFEDDRYERRSYYDDEPRYERPVGRQRGQSITIEKEREREYYSPSPPRRAPARPAFLRRQSSLDTFDRRPLTRFTEREEYGPPARYREEVRPPVLTPIPLPRSRALPPSRRYAERDLEEIRVAEPDFYGDEEYRGYPERVREREIIRRRRRSRDRSRESRVSRSVRSASSSSSEESVESEIVKNEFPKKGKTRMPSRLVHKRAITDLGYTFEEEGDVVIIQKALGRENIDEVIKLSEDYRSSEKVEIEKRSERGARSEAGTVIEERHEVFTIPPQAPPPQFAPGPPPPPPQNLEVIKDTTIIEKQRSPSPHHHHHHGGPLIVEAGPPRDESTFIERRKSQVFESSEAMPVGPLALFTPPERRVKDERAIRAEIKSLEAEKEALRLEKRARREMEKAERIRRGGRGSESDLVLYERETYERPGEEVTLVRRERERTAEPEGGVRIEKDRKGPPKKLVRAMLATLT